ncbi:MAG: bacillithiol biosynthesis cysteine-adding enzyme BshC [Gemmatimonadota bacterium]
MRIVTTALNAHLEWPAERPPGLDPALLPAFLFPSGSEAMRSRLADPQTLLVTTGQQPGLFTGPLYTIHKALSAAALARELEQRWDRPVQPVFWIAGDDHDFAEANHIAWPSPDGGVSNVILRQRNAEAPLTPMYREPLGPEIEAALSRMIQELTGGEFKDDVEAWLRRHYTATASVAESFAGALAELLAPYGIICFRSTHRAAKRATARHIVRALGLATDLDRDLAHRARELAASGQDPGVAAGDQATLVMLEGIAGRDRLVIDGDGFVTRRSGERFTLDQLQTIAADAPERLSGNVLLRPVLESAILPTVAYIAGPGELRYLALTTPVYDRMRVHRQMPLARWSGILVEPRVDRTLSRYDADLDELLNPGALETRVVRTQLPADTLSAFEEMRAAISRGYDRIQPLALQVDPTLQRPVESARRHALSENGDLEKRITQHLKRRHEVEFAQVARARTAVLPGGKPQERVYGIAPYLARYGPGTLDEVFAAVAEWYSATLVGQPLPS